MTESTRKIFIRLAPMIYGPTMLFALGEGAIVPLIPVIAAELGADIATSGLVASMLVVGQLCGNIPAGWLVARSGERFTMILAGLLAFAGVAGIALAPSLWVFTLAIFIVGMCAAAFGLARHSFMTTRVPYMFRARSLALLGGSFRFGLFAGPFIAALLLGLTGTEASAAWLFAVCLVLTVLLVTFGPDPETTFNERVLTENGRMAEPMSFDTGEPITGGIPLPKNTRIGVFRTMWNHRGVLARLGLSAAALSAVRAARQVVLPLWGFSLGLDAQSIALVIGVAGAIDFALFYASGQVMDRFGRLWAVLPSMLLMGLGFIALSFTHDVENAAMWFALLTAVIAVGNGVSSGILMTLGADLAPQHDPAPFLGSWRTLTDGGGALAPMLFSVIAAVAALGIATGVMGAIAFAGALGFWRWVPRYIAGPEPRHDEEASGSERE